MVRGWEFVSNIVHRRAGLDANLERSLFQGTVGEAAAACGCQILQIFINFTLKYIMYTLKIYTKSPQIV